MVSAHSDLGLKVQRRPFAKLEHMNTSLPAEHCFLKTDLLSQWRRWGKRLTPCYDWPSPFWIEWRVNQPIFANAECASS